MNAETVVGMDNTESVPRDVVIYRDGGRETFTAITSQAARELEMLFEVDPTISQITVTMTGCERLGS